MSWSKYFMHILGIWTLLIINFLAPTLIWNSLGENRVPCIILPGMTCMEARVWRASLFSPSESADWTPYGWRSAVVQRVLLGKFPVIRCYFFALLLYFHEHIRNVATISAVNKWSWPVIVENTQERQEERGQNRKGNMTFGWRDNFLYSSIVL